MSDSKGKGSAPQDSADRHRLETAADVASREQAFSNVLKNGAGAGLAASSVAGAAVFILSRRWPPMAHVSLPFRSFGVMGVGLAAGVIAAENTSVREQHRQYDATVSEDQRFSHAEGGIDYSKLSTKDKVLVTAKNYRWSGVAYGWAASMGASMYFVNRQPLDFKQKIVQARIYAQVITIVLLVAAGALSTLQTAADPVVDEEDTQEAIRERAMYRFKDGTDAQKRVKKLDKELHHPDHGVPQLPEGKA